jgi:hypothetical protein
VRMRIIVHDKGKEVLAIRIPNQLNDVTTEKVGEGTIITIDASDVGGKKKTEAIVTDTHYGTDEDGNVIKVLKARLYNPS